MAVLRYFKSLAAARPGITPLMIGLFGLKPRNHRRTRPGDLWCFQDEVSPYEGIYFTRSNFLTVCPPGCPPSVVPGMVSPT